ncbi:nuclear transport factor 2 family protein [Nocardioides endophyticus]|uniref:Nuclear transport factor 2 family protein n=1 Tax=Nocardioides endophyticus TaxID=1353775 RepID=A0ABP8Z127_9ACTN
MTDLRTVADHLGIQAAINTYAYGLDERRWEAWDEVFTADAVIDFRPMGGRLETPAEMSGRLSAPDPAWLFAQHPVVNVVIRLDGDTATAYSDYLVETGRRSDTPGELVRVSGGGSYEDTLVRTEAGWRISVRLVHMKWKQTRRVHDEIAR